MYITKEKRNNDVVLKLVKIPQPCIVPRIRQEEIQEPPRKKMRWEDRNYPNR